MNNKFYLLQILDKIENIIEFKKDINKEDFLNNRIYQDAIMFNILAISGLSSFLTDEFKTYYFHDNWQIIEKTSTYIINDYFLSDPNLIWQLVENNITVIYSEIKNLIKELL